MTDGKTLTIPEAMTALGVSDKTIRRLLKRGDLEKAGTFEGRILVTADSVARVAQQIGRDDPAEPDEPVYPMIPARQHERLQATNLSLAQTVQQQAAHIEHLQQTIQALQAQGDVRAELDSLRTELRAALDQFGSPPSRVDSKPGLWQRIAAWWARVTSS